MARLRPPAVAGIFYPDDPRSLEAVVEELLAKAGAPAGGAPKAVIAPHAGYVYSGSVAAHAFAGLRGARDIRRVVVIGPAHHVWVRGLAVPSASAFLTPLGAVPVDRDSIEALVELPPVEIDDAAHGPEHALEVELPFLQRLLGDFALVPIVVGSAAAEEVAEALAQVWGGPETLVVVSSDLSHYLDYDSAVRRDLTTASTLEALEPGRLGPEDACGHLAIQGLLHEARARGLACTRLALRNSGDTAGSKRQVVGYGAWAFAEAGAEP